MTATATAPGRCWSAAATHRTWPTTRSGSGSERSASAAALPDGPEPAQGLPSGCQPRLPGLIISGQRGRRDRRETKRRANRLILVLHLNVILTTTCDRPERSARE